MTRSIWSRSGSILLGIAGIVCIVVPWISSTWIGTLFIGRMLLVSSFAHALRMFSVREDRWAMLRTIPSVVVPLLIGLLILLDDGPKARSITVMLMIFFVLDGYAKVVTGHRASTMRIDIVTLVSAGVSFLLAVLLAAMFPDAPLQILALFLGADLLLMAISERR